MSRVALPMKKSLGTVIRMPLSKDPSPKFVKGDIGEREEGANPPAIVEFAVERKGSPPSRPPEYRPTSSCAWNPLSKL